MYIIVPLSGITGNTNLILQFSIFYVLILKTKTTRKLSVQSTNLLEIIILS